ncbi:MAG: hypothetical protein FIA91_05870 [Geobacter sp.]|nr:hypothetical protein [Geobacter sp.]
MKPDDKLLVPSPRKKGAFFRYSRGDGKTTVAPADRQLLLNGLAYYQGSAIVSRNRLNRTTP